jgi:RNA polymerase sigma factor (sigma-70 family)
VNGDERGIVIIADVVGSRRAPGAAGEWLRRLTRELNEAYGSDRLAPFAFTQGDEMQGLLRLEADPLRAILHASLDPSTTDMRWAIVAGPIASGRGPATERSGEAYFIARDLIGAVARARDGLGMRSGSRDTDLLLADLSPLLAELLGELSARQREIARLALVDGLRQAEVAERLGVSRATISVTWGRSRVRSIERLTRVLRTLFAAGVAGAANDAGGASNSGHGASVAAGGARAGASPTAGAGDQREVPGASSDVDTAGLGDR